MVPYFAVISPRAIVCLLLLSTSGASVGFGPLRAAADGSSRPPPPDHSSESGDASPATSDLRLLHVLLAVAVFVLFLLGVICACVVVCVIKHRRSAAALRAQKPQKSRRGRSEETAPEIQHRGGSQTPDARTVDGSQRKTEAKSLSGASRVSFEFSAGHASAGQCSAAHVLLPGEADVTLHRPTAADAIVTRNSAASLPQRRGVDDAKPLPKPAGPRRPMKRGDDAAAAAPPGASLSMEFVPLQPAPPGSAARGPLPASALGFFVQPHQLTALCSPQPLRRDCNSSGAALARAPAPPPSVGATIPHRPPQSLDPHRGINPHLPTAPRAHHVVFHTDGLSEDPPQSAVVNPLFDGPS